MFFLGRWSDSGLFPLVAEMVADTMEHLRINTRKLEGFGAAYWYFQNVNSTNHLIDRNPYNLIVFAQATIKAFEEGRLFQFLREEETGITQNLQKRP
mgnify:FL=1